MLLISTLMRASGSISSELNWAMFVVLTWTTCIRRLSALKNVYDTNAILFAVAHNNVALCFRKKKNMISLRIEAIPSHETMFLLPMLLDAEEGEERIRAVLLDPACTAYASWLDGQLVGAAVVRWEEQDPSEILYIEVAEALRGRG